MTMILQDIGSFAAYLSAFAAYQGDSVPALAGDRNRRSDSSHTLLSRLLLKPGDAVAIEDPSAAFIQHIFASTGAELIPVPVDEHGLRIDDMPTHRTPNACSSRHHINFL